MATFLQDLGHAVRIARRRPAVTLVTIFTLALGIGGNSAIFALVTSLFLRPLPVEQPFELVRIFGADGERQFDVSSYPNLADLAARSQTFAAAAIHQQTTSAYGLGDATETADIERVSGEYFPMLGIEMAHGRAIGAADDREGNAASVAVVSDVWWRTHRRRSPRYCARGRGGR